LRGATHPHRRHRRPAPSAQQVLNLVIGAGIKAVLISRRPLRHPPEGVKSVDLTVSRESLSFFLARGRMNKVTRDVGRSGGRGGQV